MIATNVRVLYSDLPAGETLQRAVACHPPMVAKRIEASLPHLPDMRKRLRRLEDRVEAISDGVE